MKFLIGGDSFYNPLTILKRNKFNINAYLDHNYEYRYNYFTGGGIYSLYYILMQLDIISEEYCLLPSYINPSIPELFDKLKIHYKYYRINSNLKIDLDFLDKIIDEKCKAFLVIDYFGFHHDNETNQYINNIKTKGISVIQDIVQAFLPKYSLIGDYCFNSFRKFIPVDGSVILSRNKLNIQNKRKNLSYLIYRHSARIIRFLEVKMSIDTSKLYLFLYNMSETKYYNYYNIKFDIYNKTLLKKININDIINKRRNHYNQLLNILYEKALIKEMPENVIPLGFPIITDNRDKLKKTLAEMNIYCSVHWELFSNILQKNHSESVLLSNNILTFPINDSVNDSNFLRYLEIIKSMVK
jgi:dTDP-4-amino-4,6-dideoxygalactose transaminase